MNNQLPSMDKRFWRKMKQLERLDKIQEDLLSHINAIYQISPMGQAPPVFHRKCQQLLNLAEKKAPIWNDIRDIIITGTGRTLWQAALACRDLGYVFKTHGKETDTCITAQAIREKLLGVSND